MSADRTPEELRDLLGAYALDALDPEERAEVDALLLTDPAARAELHELEHAAAWLGHASLRPPPRVWEGIETEIRRDAPREDVTPHATTRHTGRWVLALAALVALVVVIGSAVVVVNQDGSPDRLAQQYQEARRDDASMHASLRAAGGELTARAVVLPDGTGYLADVSLPAPGPDRVLQLWSLTPDGAVSAGVLRGDGHVHRFHAVAGTTALAITKEPRGGSRAPTSTPIVRGSMAA